MDTPRHFEVMAGERIDRAIDEAIHLAHAAGMPVTFTFNSVEVHVEATSNPVLIYRDWQRAMAGAIPPQVGPHPAPTLTEQEQAHDNAIEQENAQRQQARQATYDREVQQKREALHAKLQDAAPLALNNEEGWALSRANNQDAYGKATLDYAEQWARLMQIALAQGKPLEKIAEATSHEADVDGITGFMYGCAVSLLAQCWSHGEALRQWHNRTTQIRDEGEQANREGTILNPALLRLS